MSDAPATVRIGTAGWSLPKAFEHLFGPGTSHLARYATVLAAAEINSSFRRSHRPPTYAKWAASVPADFRFSVKLPQEITHVRKLRGAEGVLSAFLDDIAPLGTRLGCLLVQLPPSFAWIEEDVAAFFATLRDRYHGDVAVEPRHASWFADACDTMFQRYRLSRVAADPARVPTAAIPGGWRECVYWRLHGSPRTYYSSYDDSELDRIAAAIVAARQKASTVWCIFDNTTLGAATGNAVALKNRIEQV